MRTKALLGLAALAVSAITAMAADNVYSLNIVGYVNQTLNPGYNLIANPLKAGVTNGANEIMTPIPDEQILTWNGAGFNYVQYSSIFNDWVDSGLSPSSPPSLPPGKGFFLFNPQTTPVVVTFVGEVDPAPGTTNNNVLVPGYNLVGSKLPAGATPITAGPVSLPLIPDMQVLKWTGSAYSYAQYSSIFSDWVDSGLNIIPAPNYAVGEGFFLFNSQTTDANWNQSLP